MIRFAVLAESEANAKAISILTQAILGESCERIKGKWEVPFGFPHILRVIPAALEALQRGEVAEGLVIHADSDDGPIHGDAAPFCMKKNQDCRYCEIMKVVEKTLGRPRQSTGLRYPRVAVAIATPSIEAWLLGGTPDATSEQSWLDDPKVGPAGCDWRNRLKKKVYTSSRPDKKKESQRAVEAATRLSAHLDRLELAYPQGFGIFARELRGWNKT